MSAQPAAPATPRRLRLRLWPALLALVLGLAVGIGAFAFRYAQGLSYLQTDPKACANCHIMQAQYDSWQKSSHHTSAVCVDCHLPHSFVPKYLAKAENGWRHGKLFTTGGFVEPIVIQPAGKQILLDNCIQCHADLTAQMHDHGGGQTEPSDCLHCHSTVGHGPKAGLGGPSTYQSIDTNKQAP
jgi:cytochrome c nitrite reductase small subunit